MTERDDMLRAYGQISRAARPAPVRQATLVGDEPLPKARNAPKLK